MRLALAVMLGGLATAAYAEPQAADFHAAGLVQSACVDTDMKREALSSLADAKGWSALPFDAGPDGPSWGVGYDLGHARVMLTGYDATTAAEDRGRPHIRPAHLTCVVAVRNPQGDWRGETESLAARLGYAEIPNPTLAAGETREIREWNAAGKGVLNTSYDSARELLSIAIVRITDPEIRLLPSTNE
jgi:hypothetical protein